MQLNDYVINRYFNSILSLSLSLALASQLQINKLFYSKPIGSLIESASESDSKSNELKMSIIQFTLKNHLLSKRNIFLRHLSTVLPCAHGGRCKRLQMDV